MVELGNFVSVKRDCRRLLILTTFLWLKEIDCCSNVSWNVKCCLFRWIFTVLTLCPRRVLCEVFVFKNRILRNLSNQQVYCKVENTLFGVWRKICLKKRESVEKSFKKGRGDVIYMSMPIFLFRWERFVWFPWSELSLFITHQGWGDLSTFQSSL